MNLRDAKRVTRDANGKESAIGVRCRAQGARWKKVI